MQWSSKPRGVTTSVSLVLGFLFLLLSSITLASPTPDKRSVATHWLGKRYSGTPSGKIGDGGPASSDYPSDDDIRSAFNNPKGPFVFFSEIPDSTPAYNFAQSKGGVIFRQAFAAKYTIRNGRSSQWYQDFADRFSGVFAEKASGDVYVVSDWSYKIDGCRVWSRIEFPSLKANSDVDSVILVDYTNFANQKTVWTKPQPQPITHYTRAELNADAAVATLQKRDTYCFDWDGYGDDPADPDSGVDGKDPSYATGWCGVHITQYQKNEGPGSNTANYRFDVFLYDSNGEQIGEADTLDIASGSTQSVDSALPYTFQVTAGNVDSDAVLMSYAGQNWGSNDQAHHCNFGAYDSGSRNGDCGFSC